MNVKDFADKLDLKILTEGDMTREVEGCYCGDLLSWVMSRAEEGDAWLTVMGNVNAVAVAVLADCACIVLTESASLDDTAKAKALEQGVSILTTDKDTYAVASEISKLL